jgi:hypothetical protein
MKHVLVILTLCLCLPLAGADKAKKRPPFSKKDQEELDRLLKIFKATEKKDLFKVKTFKVRFDHEVTIDGQDGKLKVVEKKGKTGLDYELVYSIIDDRTALFVGNVGSQKIPFIKGTSAISFIEPTGGGYFQQLTIFNDWDSKRKGFRCVYKRSFSVSGKNPLMSNYFGVARPHD